MKIKEEKAIYTKNLSTRYQHDVKTLMDLLVELGLDTYPVDVTIHRAIDFEEVAYIDLELVKGLARFQYVFKEQEMFDYAILYNGTLFEKQYINPIQYEDDSDEEFQARCADEGVYTFEDILDKTKEVVSTFKTFVDSLGRKEDA